MGESVSLLVPREIFDVDRLRSNPSNGPFVLKLVDDNDVASMLTLMRILHQQAQFIPDNDERFMPWFYID